MLQDLYYTVIKECHCTDILMCLQRRSHLDMNEWGKVESCSRGRSCSLVCRENLGVGSHRQALMSHRWSLNHTASWTSCCLQSSSNTRKHLCIFCLSFICLNNLTVVILLMSVYRCFGETHHLCLYLEGEVTGFSKKLHGIIIQNFTVCIFTAMKSSLLYKFNFKIHLKDSDDGDLYMLIFLALSIILVFKTRRFKYWICLRPQMKKIRGGVLLYLVP
jgi:hypothetical protein